MPLSSVNPANGSVLHVFETWARPRIDKALGQAARMAPEWRDTPLDQRAGLLRQAAHVLRHRRDHFAVMMTQEMGKLLTESRAEIERCALVCEYYADHGAGFLAEEPMPAGELDARLMFQPLGTILGVMPWNFPFWQVFRFAAPTLMAGNTVLLKHASNVSRCALAIEEVFRDAGLPTGTFQTLMITSAEVQRVIEDPRVHGVTLTGGDGAGRAVAAIAGGVLKPCVLELGGSDPFVVLEDADLDEAVSQALVSRYRNAGQSCIAAKRFILVPAVVDGFLARLKDGVADLKPGDPMKEESTLAPMARADLRDELHQQVQDSIAEGAVPVMGCQPLPGKGAWYAPSILDRVVPGTRAYQEEIFGPVACILRATDEEDALRLANDTRFGLGGSVWTRDRVRGEHFARRMACGTAFINAMVKSDPRLPFGGIRDSGFGRELARAGIRAFTNAKTLVRR
ncbi:succinate-semialdehyde dehydrogenase / glutarate-semialdehyde dehydrogenase [Ectothiorhodospira magna]|uniref:Succinate-semialdehyde dehydrogenase / glutarate-semialdehyde dehydrogenase n=1 Tax=Ectothiorhodospira magna TaxID=867345 RepID=A0A1H8ZBX8_9GAMM|nr:NAD-dependent succinate-semialdehyde dehydrogenase [Ectothiorhodospira magna]SEP61940.1 succinate-semialdehyde dehydrogenase / glutarate-semialdehyde dehydrogenase [Ectothiorhodospira magna]